MNWGNTNYDTAPAGSGKTPFYPTNGARSTPRQDDQEGDHDGTSNTLTLSENLMARNADDNDWRGDFQSDDGTFKFMTLTTPNTSAAEVANWAQPTGDPLLPVNTSGAQYNTARSRHTGGVNPSMCDGSIRFVRNSISIGSRSAMGTRDGGEVFTND